jgi:hypothetical protein
MLQGESLRGYQSSHHRSRALRTQVAQTYVARTTVPVARTQVFSDLDFLGLR